MLMRKQQEAFMKTMMGGVPGWGGSGPAPKDRGRRPQDPADELAEIKKQFAELQKKLSQALSRCPKPRAASRFGASRSFWPSPKRARFRRPPSGLGVSPSAISQQLTGLEAALGAVLLDRSARPMGLTPAGAMFRRHAQTILNAEAEARADLAMADLSGLTTLRLGMIEDFDAEVTPSLLSALAARPEGLPLSAGNRGQPPLAGPAGQPRALGYRGGRRPWRETADDGWREVHPVLAEPFLAVMPKGKGH